MLPEPVVVAAFRQGGAILGAELLVAMKMASAAGFLDDAGVNYVSPFDTLAEGVDVPRAMILGDIIHAYEGGHLYNRPIAPLVAEHLERMLPWDLPRSKVTVEDPDLPGRAYQVGTPVIPAAYTFAFDNSPLGEFNKVFGDWSLTPYEESARTAAPGTVELVRWANILLGLPHAEISEDVVTKQETVRRRTETTTPDIRK